jgi:glycopeptide antibiotics resistance protein
MAESTPQLDRFRLPIRAAYVGLLLLATLSWSELDPDPGAVLRRFRRMIAPDISFRDAVDGARNVLLFAGWGLVWMLTAPSARSRASLRNAVATGAGVSLLVELGQLLSRTRTASVLDLLTNAGGALVGAAALVLAVTALETRRGGRSYLGVPTLVAAGAYGAACFFEAVVPLFRQETLPVWGGPFNRLAAALAAFDASSILAVPLEEFPLFLPAGTLAVAAAAEAGWGYRRALVAVVAAATALAGLTELGRGALGFPIHAGAAVGHAVAVAAGAALAARYLPAATRTFRGSRRARAVLGVYAVILVLWTLRPYAPELDPGAVLDKLRGDWWVPLQALAMRVDVFSVVDILTRFLLFVPLGALLAVWPLRRRGPLGGVRPALYLAALTEVAQLWVAGRTFDITDILVQAAGGAIGWAVIRRAGYRPYGEALSSGRSEGAAGSIRERTVRRG